MTDAVHPAVPGLVDGWPELGNGGDSPGVAGLRLEVGGVS